MATLSKNEFLAQLQDMLQTEAQLSLNTNLKALEEWDSLAAMVLIAFFDKELKKAVSFEAVAACETPAQIIGLADGVIV